ncbi:ATP-dependent DNA helicase DDX31-like [Clavelina lepadiformis]|uniref:ATP-dependent DNA helicase DDX31-like n=1 Tax=Clavelina lepadiformis TaxID=159417 RepID=UPI0040436D8F
MTEELTLNIVAGNGFPVTSKRNKFVGKVGKSRKQRIEARRKFKKKLLKFGFVKPSQNLKSEATKTDTTVSEDITLSEHTEKENKARVFKKEKTKLTHSLFVGNPIIPYLDIPKYESKAKTTKFANCESFAELNIHQGVKSYVLEKMQIKSMTTVQSKAIPVLLDGKDAMIRSETGSGKSLTYALPMVHNLQAIIPPISRKDGLTAIVLVPTRELALQTFQLFQRLTLPVRRIVATCIIGGQKRKTEKACLRKGCNIVVSTPGRFVDHIENTACMCLKNIRWVVFDEADRLLDMGFRKDIEKVLFNIEANSEHARQVVLLSATLTTGVEDLTSLALKDPVRIVVKSEDKAKAISDFIDPLTSLKVDIVPLPKQLIQYVTIVPSKLRLVTLLAFIKSSCLNIQNQKVLIFLSCRDSVSFHHVLLKNYIGQQGMELNDNFSSIALHGGMSQPERTSSVIKFKHAKYGVLLCTDVAARGLDIPNVDWVVQYTSPGNPVEYIHRVGRTARAGHKGNALLFLTPAEAAYASLLQRFDITVQERKMEEILCGLLEKSAKNMQYNVRLQMAKEQASDIHSALEEQVHGDQNLKRTAAKAFIAYVRAYATYPSSLKHIFHVKSLQLGHVAKSFALKNAPRETKRIANGIDIHKKKKILNQVKKSTRQTTLKLPDKSQEDNHERNQKSRQPKTKPIKHPIVSKYDLMSEFSSGLETVNFSKKRKIKL